MMKYVASPVLFIACVLAGCLVLIGTVFIIGDTLECEFPYLITLSRVRSPPRGKEYAQSDRLDQSFRQHINRHQWQQAPRKQHGNYQRDQKCTQSVPHLLRCSHGFSACARKVGRICNPSRRK